MTKTKGTDFSTIKNAFVRKYKPLSLACEKAGWDFYINSTDENMEKCNTAQQKYDDFLKDGNLYALFKSVDSKKLSNKEQHQLKIILDELKKANSGQDDKKQLDEMELNISKKYNSYVPVVDDKEISLTEIMSVLQKERDPLVRKKFYDAKLRGGDLIAKDLQQFVTKRNEYARKQGYRNFFEYKLAKDFEVNINELNELLDLVSSKISQQMRKVLDEQKISLKQEFHVDTLEAYHYGFLAEDNIASKVNKYIKSVDQLIDIAKVTYDGMGYDIDSLVRDENLILDLLPRKNKNTHAFSFWVYPGKDTRILANLSNNIESLKILNHEIGHCVYALNCSQNLCFLDKRVYPAMTEAVAKLMESIHTQENTLNGFVPNILMSEIKSSFVVDQLLFIAKCLTYINFEKQMYENPSCDLAVLWRNTRVKYMGADEKEKPDNSWATIPHFLSFPAYYQNYFRADIIKAQMYEHLQTKLGNITENKNTAAYLKKYLFKYGTALSENDLIKTLTGKKLSVDAFVRSVSR